MLIIWSNRNLVCYDKFCLLMSLIFEISQNYKAILFKIIRRKQISKISQFFACKHKINESNAKIPTHYWIVCLHSKNVIYYVFIPNKFFNFFRKLKNKQFHFSNKIKQSNACQHLHIHQGLLRMPRPLFF